MTKFQNFKDGKVFALAPVHEYSGTKLYYDKKTKSILGWDGEDYSHVINVTKITKFGYTTPYSYHPFTNISFYD